MFLRFVHLKVKEGRLKDLARFYEERTMPALQGVEGCLYASLLQPTGDDVECVSLTFWRNREAAEAYESSGLYDQLLDEMDPMLAEAAEWKVKSSGETSPGIERLQDPDVEAYPAEVAAIREVSDAVGPQRFFVRVVQARVQAGRFKDLKKRYDEEIKPALMATKGCVAVFLVENTKSQSRALSVTLWDSEEDAIRYELSGAFDQLTSRVSEFFSGLYQWKLSLSTTRDRRALSGKDLNVRGFKVVTGKRLGS